MDVERQHHSHLKPIATAKRPAHLKLVPSGITRKGAGGRVQLPAAAVEPPFVRDSYSSTALAETIDRSVHAATARFTAGLSPMMLIGAYLDWAAHLAFSPGKRFQLVEKALKKSIRLARYASRRLLRSDRT